MAATDTVHVRPWITHDCSSGLQGTTHAGRIAELIMAIVATLACTGKHAPLSMSIVATLLNAADWASLVCTCPDFGTQLARTLVACGMCEVRPQLRASE